ncbi:MAG: PKD domain-containing protein, partial [Alphaproteobacteria bacterium]
MRALVPVVFLLLLVVAVVSFADDYDLSDPSTADVLVLGPEEAANLGYSVAAGDLDGDDIPDMIVGAPALGNTWQVYRRGGVFLLFSRLGYLDGGIFDLATEASHAQLLGSPGQFTGTDVAAGDLNNDGIDDLIVGAARAAGPGGELILGAVFVFYGRADWPPTFYTAEADVTIWGEKADGQFGSQVAVGDFDGDGIDDLFASAPNYEAVGQEAAGKVYGFRGGALPAEIDLRVPSVEADVEVTGGLESMRLGIGLAAGDINGDGQDDLLLGAPGLPMPLPGNKEANDGSAYVIMGRALTDTLRIDLATDAPDVRLLWPDQLSNLGLAVAAGDINDDGWGDLAVSAPNVPTKDGAGQVFVLYGRATWPAVITLSTADVTVYGPEPGDRFGFALAFGDSNGDCVDDLYIGAPRFFATGEGHVYVVAGSREFPQEAQIDLAVDEPLHRIIAAQENDHIGFALATADIDANGAADLLIGGRAADLINPERIAGGAMAVLLSDDENLPPVADAGPDRTTVPNVMVVLDGTGSYDPEGAPLTYQWEQMSGPDNLAIHTPGDAAPYIIPVTPGIYVFELVVYDCLSASEPDQMQVEVVELPDEDDDTTADDDDDTAPGDDDTF